MICNTRISTNVEFRILLYSALLFPYSYLICLISRSNQRIKGNPEKSMMRNCPNVVCLFGGIYCIVVYAKLIWERGILLIQLYWSKSREPRSDSNIILCESEKKLIQLIHDKQFHLIMIGHPRARFSFMRISLILHTISPQDS